MARFLQSLIILVICSTTIIQTADFNQDCMTAMMDFIREMETQMRNWNQIEGCGKVEKLMLDFEKKCLSPGLPKEYSDMFIQSKESFYKDSKCPRSGSSPSGTSSSGAVVGSGSATPSGSDRGGANSSGANVLVCVATIAAIFTCNLNRL